jgi:hypothetical protein
MIELGARAWAIVFVMLANKRKNMLIERAIVNARSKKKKKNGPASRRKLVMKYRVELTTIEFMIL